MSRRDFRTPSNIPETGVGRCIVVPNDAAWLGLLNAALLMLTEHWRYDQVEATDLTPEETAAIWYDIYVSTLASACEDCPDMNCNDVLACIADAGYLLQSPSLPDDQRVVDGVPQVSFDGGTTWVDVFGDTGAAPIVKSPVPTDGANDDAKICLASSRAALVLAEFYKQTFGAFTADITNALGTFNNFLQELNSALLGLAYGQAAQMLNAEIMRDQDWETNYTAAELSSGALEDLLCLLVDNASVDETGVVTFDYGAIRDNIIADVGINPGTALWFLLGNMQENGLNAAGSVRITDTMLDCSPCAAVTWCYRFTFTAGQQGFSAVQSGGTPMALWQSSGMYFNARIVNGETNLRIQRVMPEAVITRVKIEATAWNIPTQTAWAGNQNTSDFVNFVPLSANVSGQVREEFAYIPFADGDIFRLDLFSTNGTGDWAVFYVEMEGIGENPFGEDNC